MCAICGCDGHSEDAHEHEHVHADGTRHRHSHAQGQHRSHDQHDHIDLEARVLAKNDALADDNARWLAEHEILGLNLMGAPGCGKTSLLERTVRALGPRSMSVIEGDQATSNDAERIRAAGAPVVQVNTGTGCHLDATMVASSLSQLAPGPGSVVVIENVGNLVCPALFRLGEQCRVVVLSVAEGDDKPIKYPHMFRAAHLIVINKTDLLPYVDFRLDHALASLREVNAEAEVLALSARTGEGMERWYDWLGKRLESLGHRGERGVEPPGHSLRIER